MNEKKGYEVIFSWKHGHLMDGVIAKSEQEIWEKIPKRIKEEFPFRIHKVNVSSSPYHSAGDYGLDDEVVVFGKTKILRKEIQDKHEHFLDRLEELKKRFK